MPEKRLFAASDDELGAKFASLQDRADIAAMLEVPLSRLTFHLYRLPLAKRYATFEIKKRSGGTRIIRAPISALKIIQRKLAYVLALAYQPKLGAHGFIRERSIVTNAERHVTAKFVLNLDLKDFFPSINFGRVRGMFMAAPYKLDPSVAAVLAQICCFENALPQGAPTSPIISNMICARLDSQLRGLAKKHHCVYTRYADDITFSTSLKSFPRPIAHYRPTATGEELALGPELQHVLDNNGFVLNADKLRLQTQDRRQEVTGLTTNRLVNVKRTFVRQVRAMLHAWQKYGYNAAEREFQIKYDHRHRARPGVSFKHVVKGKLDFLSSVRGKDDPVYLRLLGAAHHLDPALFPISPQVRTTKVTLTELQQALWVLECEETDKQGTAFMLAGVGLVTCEHVLGTATKAFQAHDFNKKYSVTILARNETVDLAILEMDTTGAPALEAGEAEQARVYDQVTLLGFPNYRWGDTGVSIRGEVIGTRVASTVRRLLISAPIIVGNSGGPVLDAKNRVIGVAVTGADSFANAGNTENHGVIPISALKLLGS